MEGGGLETVPGQSLTYSNQTTFGVVAGKGHNVIAPKYGGNFKQNDIIRLELPAQAYLNPAEFFIAMRVSLFAGAGNIPGIAADTANAMPYIDPRVDQHSSIDEASGTANSFNYSDDPDLKNMTYLQVQPGIQNLFNRVRLLAGSVVLEDLQDYDVLYAALLEGTTDKDWQETDGRHEEGYYDPGNPIERRENANLYSNFTHNGATNQGPVWCFRPLLGLFKANKHIPLKYMGQLTLELYCNTNAEALVSSVSSLAAIPATEATGLVPAVVPPHSIAAVPNRELPGTTTSWLMHGDSTSTVADYPNAYFQISDVEMHVPFEHPTSSYDEEMQRQIESGNIEIYHSTWNLHARSLSAPDPRVVLSFQERAASLKGGLALMRNSPQIRDIRCFKSFVANGIQAFQWKIGAEYIPQQEVSCVQGGSRALAEVKKMFGTFGDPAVVSNIRQENFLPIDLPHALDTMCVSEMKAAVSQPSKFMIALDLEKSAGQQSGFDSAASAVDVELILKLKNHVDYVGVTSGAYMFKGAPSGLLWQPTKVLARADAVQNCVDGSGFIRTEDSAFFRTSPLGGTDPPQAMGSGIPNGFMQALNVTTVVNTSGTTVANAYNPGSHASVTANESGHTCRVYFFAHIDQVLKLTSVGRMEIIR